MAKYSLGIDIGSAYVKAALMDDAGQIRRLAASRIVSNPREAANELLDMIGQDFGLENITAVGVSGSGKAVVPRDWGWVEYSSSLAVAAGLLHNHSDARTIFQIGGQSSLVVELEDGLKKPWKVASNPLCAAGTGRFLEQQAYRLGIKTEDLGALALQYQGKAPRIAARCSVFAKSDLIHLQQKGVSVEAMLSALCESVARMVMALKKGAMAEPIYFVGGVSSNRAVAEALNRMLSERNGRPTLAVVPENSMYMEAIGSALLCRGRSAKVGLLPENQGSKFYYTVSQLRDFAVSGNSSMPGAAVSGIGYLGVDVGSTSTKAVILDQSGKTILAKSYLMTAGQPVEAVKQVFSNLLKDGAERISIAGVGVTGSGRYLIGRLIGADLIKNEITAQARAAAEIDPDADIIEIGGQDSKLIIKRRGVVVDYRMNKACAAGTGSFVDEMAELLGISVKNGQFAELALSADQAVDLGSRCAAFMGQAVHCAQSEGASLPAIAAGLANSIVGNYLSKVVGNLRLGDKVILTGAVFYNKALVAAFKQQLADKNLKVAEHCEVTGAIGAALLAKEAMAGGRQTKFKGFQTVVQAECHLTSFTCQFCDNNCSITRMTATEGRSYFYGSRCDRYDAAVDQAVTKTFFEERERLLFRGQDQGRGGALKVGIPRALLTYDYAPLMIGFLNALQVEVVLSGSTNRKIIEDSIELAYTDSCFPIKLAYGHVAALKDADFILFPSAIRLGRKEGKENQKYACPLVQASPFIIRSVLGLGSKLLTPVLDFSRGDDDVLAELRDAAQKMGFSADQSRKAALAGLEAQRRYEVNITIMGTEAMERFKAGDRLGVVILSRSYMSQDFGANLGIAEKLAQLGVEPIPLDFLPLSSVESKKFSDRPYWWCEGKLLATADIVSADPRLFGLVLTNFGCGPNSFIIKHLEDIMGDKPMGQLEIDEHSAEAGLVTRLEAFVDTIVGFARSGRHSVSSGARRGHRRAIALPSSGRTVIIPRMSPHADVVAAAMEAYGVKAVSLPEPDERNLIYSNRVTSGAECLPYRVTLGDFLRFKIENGHNPEEVEGFMGGSFGPCRFGKYAVEQIRALREAGFELPIRAPVSDNAYRDQGLGPGFQRLAWKSMVAVDSLQRLLWRVRPYEKEKGAADRLFEFHLQKLTELVRSKKELSAALRQAGEEFASLINNSLPRRPLVGINGEIYLRCNRFSNKDLVRVCEDFGLEATVSPMGEWIKYIFHRNLEDAVNDGKPFKTLMCYIRKRIQRSDENSITRSLEHTLPVNEPSLEEILDKASCFLSLKCGGEAVLSLGTGIKWLESPDFAGVISVMPHGCMPGGVVAAMADKISAAYNKPWICLTYDGFPENNNSVRISEFAELIKYCSRPKKEPAGAGAF